METKIVSLNESLARQIVLALKEREKTSIVLIRNKTHVEYWTIQKDRCSEALSIFQGVFGDFV